MTNNCSPFMAMIMLRVNHSIRTSELLAREHWRAGAIPLQEGSGAWLDEGNLLSSIIETDEIDRFRMGAQRQGLYGWFAGLTSVTDASPDKPSPTVIHLPTVLRPPSDSLKLGRNNEVEVRVELIPISASASLGSQSKSLPRDAFLCFWLFGRCTPTQMRDLNRKLRARFDGTRPDPLGRASRPASGALVFDLLKVVADTPSGDPLVDFEIPEQMPFALVGLESNAGSQTEALHEFRGIRWTTSDSSILTMTAGALKTTFARSFIVDSAVALRVAAIQTAQTEAIVARIQGVSTDRNESDKEITDLHGTYQEFKRRHVWQRMARRSQGNVLLPRLLEEWGAKDMVEQMDTELRDYERVARQRREEREKDDQNRWQSIAQIASLLIAVVAILGTWAAIAAVHPDDAVWTGPISVLLLSEAMLIAFAVGTFWVAWRQRMKTSIVAIPAGAALLVLVMYGFGELFNDALVVALVVLITIAALVWTGVRLAKNLGVQMRQPHGG